MEGAHLFQGDVLANACHHGYEVFRGDVAAFVDVKRTERLCDVLSTRAAVVFLTYDKKNDKEIIYDDKDTIL